MRVGLIGCGFMGRMHAEVYGLLENAELTAVADRRPETAREMGERFGVRAYGTLAEMLLNEELDAVDVCLPTFLHREATVEAARAGKHVLCEKPMALTLHEADDMIRECELAGVQLMIGHCIRFWPAYAMLKRAVEDGAMGRLLSVNLTRYGEFPTWSSDNWLADESRSGGGVLDMHIHDTDYALYLLGEPDELASFGTVDDRGPSFVFTTLQYRGCVAHLEGGWNLPARTPFKMAYRAIFERGALFFDGGPVTAYRPGSPPIETDFPAMPARGGGNISDLGGYYHEIKYFVDCLEAGTPFQTVTPQTSRLSLATVLREIEQIRARHLSAAGGAR